MPPKPKRPSPLDEPPTASSSSDSDEENQKPSSQQRHQQPQRHNQDSSSEETEADEEETEDEEEEEEQQPSHVIKPVSKNPPPPTTKPSSSSEESDSDSGSDSEPDPPKVEPLASKPMDRTPKPKPRPNQTSPGPNKSATKRPGDNNGHVSEPKRAKKKATGDAGSDDENDEDAKKTGIDPKNPFKRIFSEENELAILKGITDFTAKTGLDPLKNGDAFHDFIKKTIRLDANSHQLKQKIQRLRKKFINAAKGKNGEAPKFSKPHDQKSFELSKKIWGHEIESNNGVVEKAKNNGKTAKSPKKESGSSGKNVGTTPKQKSKSEGKGEQKLELLPSMDAKESGKVDEEKHDKALALSSMVRFGKGLTVSGLDEDVAKKGIELMEASKREELEGKWRKLQDAEMELYVKRAELVAEQARLILQAYRSSKN